MSAPLRRTQILSNWCSEVKRSTHAALVNVSGMLGCVTFGRRRDCCQSQVAMMDRSNSRMTFCGRLCLFSRGLPSISSRDNCSPSCRQTYDPVTPLSYAKLANNRLGNNARLIQQTDGVGHTALGQPSLCTAAATRAYFINGTMPAQKVTQCPVDVQPFASPQDPPGPQRRDEESTLVKAWVELSQKRPSGIAWGL